MVGHACEQISAQNGRVREEMTRSLKPAVRECRGYRCHMRCVSSASARHLAPPTRRANRAANLFARHGVAGPPFFCAASPNLAALASPRQMVPPPRALSVRCKLGRISSAIFFSVAVRSPVVGKILHACPGSRRESPCGRPGSDVQTTALAKWAFPTSPVRRWTRCPTRRKDFAHAILPGGRARSGSRLRRFFRKPVF